jgi:hypothetical protein
MREKTGRMPTLVSLARLVLYEINENVYGRFGVEFDFAVSKDHQLAFWLTFRKTLLTEEELAKQSRRIPVYVPALTTGPLVLLLP